MNRATPNNQGVPAPEKLSDPIPDPAEGVSDRFKTVIDEWKARNVSQNEIARRMDVASSTLTRIKNGGRSPDVDTMLLFCSVTGVAVEWILWGDLPKYANERGAGFLASDGTIPPRVLLKSLQQLHDSGLAPRLLQHESGATGDDSK